MRRLAFVAAIILAAVPAIAQNRGGTVRIGVIAPRSGAQAILGKQVIDGAKAALATKAGAATIVEADTQCSAKGGEAAARELVKAKATIALGFLCTPAIEAALPVLKQAGIVTLDVGVRANRLTDKKVRTGDLIYRLAPRSGAAAAAITRFIEARWADQPFGLIDDGSIASRGLSDSVRRRLGDDGLKPQTVDNYRPAEEKQFGLARRLQRTGVTRFFIAGDRPDIAIIARDAKALGLDLTILGDENLFDEASVDTPLPAGIIAIGPKTSFPELAPKGTDLSVPGSLPPQGYFGTAYAAMEVALEASAKAGASKRSILTILASQPFDTGLGAIRFDGKGDSDLDLFRVFEWQGEKFVEETGG
ncbi:ABC transporter substrate-binding protein [Jiella sp. MQZ9-1]|uniref:ABC transporter substrate-binding protein n=1 Tax=Jiella flava TaxID=2816857 RepID=A0A939JWV9_9HYPH|nr:ABC transporter substrate-binding protein [Jiella flava]MBO0662721.1 ABC transporter substrate-binding protein [Jiella flava]MCD2471143.1 ABC transporter substrate-binding protein [Jiella flava]